MKIGIIGAGVMGLTLGYRLSQSGHEVEIIESGSQIGGLSTWHNFEEFVWDKYYHVILRSDEHLLGLIDDLGLTDQLHWAETKTGFLWNGQHISMSNYLEFLTFPALNFLQKIRLGAGLLYCPRVNDLSKLERVSAKEWLITVFGEGVYLAIWEPLLESKFGQLKEKVPATIIHSTICRYYSTRGSDGKEKLGHLKQHGLKVLLETMENRIKENQGKVHCGTKVSGIKQQESEIVVETDQKKFSFDHLISTIPTTILQKIAPNLDGIYTKKAKPEFLGVIRLALVLKRPLSQYYVTNLIDKGHPYTGIIEVSQLATPDELFGKHFVMLPRYDVPHSEWFNKSDQEITTTFINKLEKTWPDIKENILHQCVHREKSVMALWIDAPPEIHHPASTTDGRIVSINSELAGRSTLNNNALVEVANRMSQHYEK